MSRTTGIAGPLVCCLEGLHHAPAARAVQLQIGDDGVGPDRVQVPRDARAVARADGAEPAGGEPDLVHLERVGVVVDEENHRTAGNGDWRHGSGDQYAA